MRKVHVEFLQTHGSLRPAVFFFMISLRAFFRQLCPSKMPSLPAALLLFLRQRFEVGATLFASSFGHEIAH